MRRISLITLSVSAAFGAGAQSLTEAQLDSLEAAWNRQLDEVVVTGTRTPKLLKDSPVLTRVISSADIRKVDATNISDLLQAELPGIEFSYSMNQQVSLNMQGFGGNSVLFLIDGERVAGETLDNVDYSRLNLANVQKIEIVKGAASALYGSNAVGGVVNIISREASEPWTLNVNGRYGDHNEQRYGATGTFNLGRVNSNTSIQYTSIDSYDMKNTGDYNRFYGGHSWNFKERLIYRPIDKLALTGRAGYFFRERESGVSLYDRYRDFSAGLKGVYGFSTGHDLELSYSFDQYDKSDYAVQSKRDVRDYSNVQNIVKAVYNLPVASKHTLTVGADFMRDYLMTYQFSDNGNKKQITADGFAQFDMNFFRNFNVIAGIRYDYFSESSLQHVSPRLSAMYKWRRWAFRGCYAGGFRAPTLKEMYMDFDMAGIFMIYGNPDLKPESSQNFQISAEYTRGLFNLNIGGFCNLVDNRMTTAWNQALNGMVYTNIRRVIIGGIDAGLAYKTNWGGGAKLNYMYTREKVKHGDPYSSSTRPHTATIMLDYTHRWKNYGFTVALNGRVLSPVTVDEFTSSTSYEETESVRYPGYTMWKLNISQSVWKGIDINFLIDNLFNYVPKYNYSSTPSTTGISLSVGASINIDAMFK